MRELVNRYIDIKSRRYIFGYVCVAPAFISLVIFFVLPFIEGIYTSLQSGYSWNLHYVGIINYVDVLTDWRFWNSVKVTLIFTLLYAVFSIIISLILAVVLQSKIRHKTFFTAAIFTPYIVTRVIAGLVWQYMYNENFGVLNYLLNVVGIGSVPWLKEAGFAMVALAIVQIWLTIGYNMVLFSSGLQAIPDNYYEAAKIDGANGLQQLIFITVPLLLPTLFFVITISILQGFIHSFVIAKIITGGGPLNATNVLMLYIYQLGLEQFDLPRANAVTLLAFILLFIVSIIQYRVQDRLFQGVH